MQFELKKISSRFVQENIYQKSIEFNNSCVSIKIKKKIRNFIERYVFNEIKTHTYVIKFQKRNLFRVYILIINHFLNEITNDNVDVVDKIVISLMSKNYVTNSKFKKTRLYDLMTSHMIHKNCFKIKNVVCHDKNDICIKRFFKSQRNITNLNHSFDYSQMRRFSRKCVSNISWNNIWIVSYNEYLLLKYQIYINVEICTSIKSMIYFYKYVFKNFDFVDVFLQVIETIAFVTIINVSMIHRNDTIETMNEIKIFHDCKWIESCETAWKILNLFFDEIKSTVSRLQMHAQNVQRVLFNFNDRVIRNQFQKNEFFRQITLIEYFRMNVLIKHCKKIDESFFYEYNDVNKNFKIFFYQNISIHWIWHKFFKIWKSRKMNKCVDRMYFIDVKIDEMFYLRLLLVNRMNCIFFENLKTMFVQIENAKKNQIELRLLNIYKNACRAFELIDNDDEWHAAMTKITKFDTIVMLKNLIMIILLKCESTESKKLWEIHKIA